MKVKKLLKENTEKVLHTKANGDKLVANDSGHGYSAYTKNNVPIGQIEAETDAAAVVEFSKKQPKYESMNEDYLNSAEFRIQRYEDEIPELFHKVHDGYMSGVVNAKAYADALATIFSALDEIDYDASNIHENLETEDEQDIGNGELIGRIENGKFNVYQGEDVIGSFDSQSDAEDSGYNVFENLNSSCKNESVEITDVIEDTNELMNTIKKLVKEYNHMMLVNPVHCKILDDDHGRRLDISPATTVMESSKCSTRIEEAKEESNLPESSDIENDSSHQTKIEDIEFVMMEYINADFGVDFVKKITPTTYQVCYNDEVVTLEFDPDWPEYVYTIEGKGPHAHRSYEFIISDIQDYIAQYRNEYDDDYDDLSAFDEDYEVRRANKLYGVVNESSNGKIKVGNYVTHIDDNPPTRGVVVKVDGDMATVQVGDPAKKDYVDVPLNKLQLDEAFDRRSNINLFMVGVKVSNLLGVDALGEDNWIEFDCGDVRDVAGGELHMPFEAIGEDKELRGSMMTNKGRIDVKFRNGSEAKCDTPEEIARFVAGEFGISL